MRQCRTSRRFRTIFPAAAAALLSGWAASRNAAAQYANPVINGYENGFQAAPAGSLEWQVIDRLAASHRYSPRDLPWLARMTVLESIAMYEAVRADLPDTLTGRRIEGEMSILWDSAQLLYQSTNYGDPVSLVRARPMLGAVEAAYLRLDSDLGAMPAVSQVAAFHLRDIARVLPVMNNLIDAMETDERLMPRPTPRQSEVEVLRGLSSRLLEELDALIAALGQARPVPKGRDSLLGDLEAMRDQARAFDRLLAMPSTGRDLVESARVLRSLVWPLEYRLVARLRDRGLVGRWRSVRREVEAITDRLGLARVVAPEAVVRPTVAADRRLLAQADRALIAVDSMILGTPAEGGGPAYHGELESWRRKLLEFRRQAASGASNEALSRTLGEVEDITRRIGARSQSEVHIYRGGARLDTSRLQAPAQAVEKIRTLMPRPASPSTLRAPSG